MPIKTKKSMTSFDVAAVAKELEALRGSRIVNIYSLPGGGFLFKLRPVEANLVAVPAVRVHLTRYDVAEKGFPPPLVMGLRKHLRGGKIVDVGQVGFDRILVLRVEAGGAKYSVYVEVLPRGVLALVDEEGTILQVSETRRMKDRVVKRGAKYQPPPGSVRLPTEIGVDTLTELLASDGEAVRVLVRGLGYPGEVVEEALLRVGVEPSIPASEVRERAADIVEAFRDIYKESLRGHGYIVYDNEGNAVTVVPFEPKGLAGRYGLEYRRLESFSEALDTYFVKELKRVEERELASQAEAERKKLLHSIERARRNLEELREKINKIEKLMMVVGENITQLYEALECARRVQKENGWDYIVGTCPHVVDVRPSEGLLVVSLGGELVQINIRQEPHQLLVELSKRRGEIEAKIRRGEEALKTLEQKLGELERKVEALTAQARAMVRKKEWYERYHWLVTSHGFLAVGGRDASQNENVVKKYLNERRIFMHADIHGAPIVVLFAEGQQPPEQDLREAALLTAAYSKAWKTGLSSVDVYWVWGSQVSKSAPAGEYLAKGAFMVYGKRNYIRGVELRLGLGVAVENDAPIVIVGPPDLVKRRALVYAVLVPGDEDPSRLAKRLRRLLAAKASEESKPIIDAVKVEDIRLRLPGRARVIHVGRGEAKEPPRPIRYLFGEEAGQA